MSTHAHATETSATSGAADSTRRRLAVLGSGDVGRALAAGFAAAGHQVVLGTRDPAAADIVAWAAGAGVRLATPHDAARDAEILVNATPGAASVGVVTAAGGHDLDGVTLLDVSNPLDFTGGAPNVFTDPDDSIGEQLQQAFPRLRVVKSLCTVNNAVMVNPAALPEPTTMFVAGDDPGAKQSVTDLLGTLGWAAEQVLDVGGIEASRQLERNILFWLRIHGAVGTPDFNIRVVRAG